MGLTGSMAKLASTVAVGVHDTLSTVSPIGLPGRSLALAPAMLGEGTGQDVLDYLGHNTRERARQMGRILGRFTEPELAQLMEAVNEALQLRARAMDDRPDRLRRRR